jgi:hypothetical protein
LAIPDFSDPDVVEALNTISRGTSGGQHVGFVNDPTAFFAHYTSVDVIQKIADGRGFVLRNSRLMNDHSEVIHGFELLRRALEITPEGSRYVQAWSEILPTAASIINNVVSFGENKLANNCYVLSLCEHREPDDEMGKLSMWRAYGSGEVRVAVVAQPKPLLRFATAGLMLVPVVYGDLFRIRKELEFRAQQISRFHHVLRKLPAELLAQAASGLTVNFGVAIKHPGFAEEREWRFIYMSDFATPEMEQRRAAVVFNGVPQIVYKLPIYLPSDENYHLASLFMEKIIIGPCSEIQTVRTGLVALMNSYGFSNADEWITASGIPYRQKI